MTDLLLFLKGVFIGLAISAPIGPVGVLVLRRAMLNGFGTGVTSGLGAAIADGFLSALLALGLAAASGFFDRWAGGFRAVGGVFLVVIGWWVWHSSPPHEMKPLPPRRGTIGDLVSIFLLTISNPMTILGITGIFAGLGVLAAIDTHLHAAVLIAGVFSGSLLWWIILSGIGMFLRDRVSGTVVRRINQLCGIVLAVVGVIQVALLAFMAIRG
jgi:threonine/homoserine/homoserine lactone efflux protein